MDDMIRMLRRLSRQGVPVEGIARRLLAERGELAVRGERAVRGELAERRARGASRRERGEFRLHNDERLLLEALFQNDGISLPYGDWDTLRALIESAAAPPEPVCWYPYQGVQRLRVEPVMRVHRQNDL